MNFAYTSSFLASYLSTPIADDGPSIHALLECLPTTQVFL